MEAWVEIISIYLMSAIKFLFAPAIAKEIGFTYLNTILVTTLGGISGVIVFFNLGTRLVDFFPGFFKPTKTNKKTFTKTNKFYVKLIRDYGLIGLAVFSPILISIPVGSILAARFFQNRKQIALLAMSSAVVIWSVSLSTFLFMLL